jgi:UDP-glucose 4-epimerase
MKVLVTGASGFLGRYVVPKLVAAGACVTAHGRSASPFGDVEYLTGDLASDELLAPWRWDAVINLAGPVTAGNEDLAAGMDIVAQHTRIALQLRRLGHRARIVHASSMTVYGRPERLPVDEAHPRRPQHFYGLAKVIAEDVLADLDTRIVRLPGLFSEQRASGALYHFCKAARAGQPLVITTPTPTVWDILHVADAADALILALHGSERGAFNISYGEPVELVAIARWIAAHGGRGSRVETSDTVHPPFQLDIVKARHVLGWVPPQLYARLADLYEAYAA